MIKILDEEKDTLQLEIALIEDTASQNASFCNSFEGDGGSLAFMAFDAWELAEQTLKRVIGTGLNSEFPLVRRVAARL